jgi:actin-related protein 6
MPVLLLDNGAGHIKAAYMTDSNPLNIPNATASVQKTMQRLVGDEINACRNGSVLQFCRPFERGYLVNWQCQIEVWNHVFEKLKTPVNETSLILTEPLLNPSSIQHECNEVVFEYFGFKEYVRKPAMWFSSYKCSKENACEAQNVCTIVESGFSSTYVAPFFNFKCYRPAV